MTIRQINRLDELYVKVEAGKELNNKDFDSFSFLKSIEHKNLKDKSKFDPIEWGIKLEAFKKSL